MSKSAVLLVLVALTVNVNVVKCPDPPEIEDGEIMNLPSGNVVYSTAILYRCKKGVLIGNKELVCTAQGNYSSKPPQCEDISL
ncbi:complement decay-accelerating factor transmembrane isoform-like [Acipenser ruthenus]|uniref:complement decay-accelerating factor transmembrane isoform-like n=1 Tax=Acipenser ruthenus TaxID=7906 RepID=UPI0027405A75|nr:complement decay-accelerating factor transmembrane isoform-like [Acipenser ruthenus]